MNDTIIFIVLIGSAILVLVAAGIFLLRDDPASPTAIRSAIKGRTNHVAADLLTISKSIVEWTPERVRERFLCLAFDVETCGGSISAEHLEVLQSARRKAADAMERSEHFPRRPRLLPQLLRAINDSDSTRKEIADVILQDPVLTGEILKLANSAYYRVGPNPIASIEKAIVILGQEGIKSVVATALLQPVFRMPGGRFPNFSARCWDYSLLAAKAASAYALRTRRCDRFTAHLLGLIAGIGPLVLFRVVSDAYVRASPLLPNAEVFIRTIYEQADRSSELIAGSWDISSEFMQALQEQSSDYPPASRGPLGQAAYYSKLCAQLTILTRNGQLTPEAAKHCLEQQKLAPDLVTAMWGASQLEALH
jgi:HD-like signal output (HDOD) protein